MVDKAVISNKVFEFLRNLRNNNNREWFEAHKPDFLARQAETKSFLGSVKANLDLHDDIEKLKMFRIYRDVRFSLDKTPYKTYFAGSFPRMGAHLRGGYYIQLEPGSSFLACGFWNPAKDDLLRIRKELEMDADDFREVLADKNLKDLWGPLKGERVKTAPKGFDRQHPDIDLIAHKQFIFVRDFNDAQVLSDSFLGEVDRCHRAIRPFFDLMSLILTTDLNGESVL